jgi:hypothetical protein
MTAWNDPPLSRVERLGINLAGLALMLLALGVVGYVLGGA